MPKWYISGGRTEDELGHRNDTITPPLVGYGDDRLQALVESGITVWSEEEWNAAKQRKAGLEGDDK